MNLSFNHRLTSLLTLGIAILFLASCSDDTSTGSDPVESQLDIYTVTDLPANPAQTTSDGRPETDGPDYTFYNLRTNSTVTDADSASNNWDIAFSGLNILVNNGVSGPGQAGAVVLDVPFEEVTTAPSEGYSFDTDSTYAISEWYRYTRNENPKHAVIPHENKTIIIRTADGKHYAKLHIISYYKGNPDTSSEKFANTDTRAPGRYFTFKYAIQMNGSRELK